MDETPETPSESDLKKVENFLKGINKNKAPKVRKKRKVLSERDKQKLCSAIVSRLSEFLDCYILLGYDVNGNSLVLINSQNNLESRGLSDLLEDFMITGGNNVNLIFDDEDDVGED